MRDLLRVRLGLAILAGLFVLACVRISWADRTYKGAPVSSSGHPATDGGIGEGPRQHPSPRPQRTVEPTPTPAPTVDATTEEPVSDDTSLESGTAPPDDEQTDVYPHHGDAHRDRTMPRSDDSNTFPTDRRSPGTVQVSLPWWLPIALPIPMPNVSYPTVPMPNVSYPSGPVYIPNVSYPTSVNPWARTRRSSTYVQPWSNGWSTSPQRRSNTRINWRRHR